MATGRYWRDAATVILAAKSSRSTEYDYEILLLKRSGEVKFHSESYVFPGGSVSPGDQDIRWRNLFSKYGGQTLEEVASALGNATKRPPVLCDDERPSNQLTVPKCIAMRITAIRETFEESGILLLTQSMSREFSKPQPQVPFELNKAESDKWRKLVTSDPMEFISFCEEVKAVPNVWALVDWSNWLTPVIRQVTQAPKKPKRYDTIFFLCCLDRQPEVEVDGSELVTYEWHTPASFIIKRGEGKIDAGVPQRVETLRLCHFLSLHKLCQFSYQRSAQYGVERYLVVVLFCADGLLAVYPGDDLYPVNPDPEGFGGVLTSVKTIAQLRVESTKFHRLEHLTSTSSSFICNLDEGQLQGHRRPADEAAIVEQKTSVLARL